MKNISLLLLAGSALLLASCDKLSTPQPVTVSGQVKELIVSDTGAATYTGWTGGAGKVIASVEGQDNLATAALAADGKFSLTLPKLDAALLSPINFSSDLPAGCTGDLKTSGASDARGNAASFRVEAAQKSGEIAPAALETTFSGSNLTALKIQSGGYVYADKAVGLSGKLNCTENGTPVTSDINLQLGAGWNKVTFTISTTQQGGTVSSTVSVTTGSLPAQWIYLEGASSLSQQALNGSALAQPALKVAKALPFFR
ncbi:hypothetical protein [Deinococcus aluminii]|uniref:Lipoprotein n=1 Tax=Deinococcus aluminii TaxID=1656885 RepID=A0ABP9XB06_9DEIO